MVDKLKELGRRRRRAEEERNLSLLILKNLALQCSNENLALFSARILYHSLQQSCSTGARILQVNTHLLMAISIVNSNLCLVLVAIASFNPFYWWLRSRNDLH